MLGVCGLSDAGSKHTKTEGTWEKKKRTESAKTATTASTPQATRVRALT